MHEFGVQYLKVVIDSFLWGTHLNQDCFNSPPTQIFKWSANDDFNESLTVKNYWFDDK